MQTAVKKQDMPPSGGYQSINFKRVPAKSYFSGVTCVAIYAGATIFGMYCYALNWRQVRQDKIEMRSARIALHPLLLAERDREYLKQLRRNRDEEAKLMANVKGWEVGKLYGEPVYKTVPKDKLVNPTCHEFYVHSRYRDYAERTTLEFWS